MDFNEKKVSFWEGIFALQKIVMENENPSQQGGLFPLMSFVWMRLNLLDTILSEIGKTEYAIVNDIDGLFAQKSTKYLRKSCSMEMTTKKQNLSKRFGFIIVPQHVTTEFAKI